MDKPVKTRYCIAFGCFNTSKKFPALSFFSLPKDPDRRREWLEFLDREDMLSKESLNSKSYLVCSAHFEDSEIKTLKVLNSGAVPTIARANYTPNDSEQGVSAAVHVSETTSEVHVQPNIKVMTMQSMPQFTEKRNLTATQQPPLNFQNPKRLDTANVQTQTKRALIEQMINDSPKIRKLTNDLRLAENTHKKLQRECMKIQTELAAKNASITIDPEDEINQRFQKLIDWQNKFRNKHKGNRYGAEYKMFALTLLYSSPKTYQCLETVLKLPSKSTLKNIKVTISPKLGERALKSLSIKMKSLPETAKFCTICVNNKELKRHLYYDVKADEVIGIQNVDGKKSSNIASQAYVVMIQGINYNWSQPIAYAFLDSTENYFELDAWINVVIRRLSGEGVQVKALIAQQGSNFDTSFKKVKNITFDKPHFFLDEQKIYYILDVQSLLLWTRIDLMSNNFHREREVVSWNHIKELYEDQKQKKLTLIPEITDEHINVAFVDNTEIMKFQDSIKVFSYKMYAALETYVDFGKISEEARATAKFIKILCDLFEVLNPDETAQKTAFTMSQHQKCVFEEAFNMFASLTTDHKTDCIFSVLDNTEKIQTFINFQISIRSITELFEDLQKEGVEQILTTSLSQSNLESFFKTIDLQRRLYRKTTTPIQFTRFFSRLFISKMLDNSQSTDNELNMHEILVKVDDIVKTEVTMPTTKTSQICLDDEEDYTIDLPKQNAIPYVASYLMFKCTEKHKCDDFSGVMDSLQDFAQIELFSGYEACNENATFHGSMKVPPQEVIEYVDKLETIFIDKFSKCHEENPGNQIYELLKEIPPVKLCLCYPTDYFLKLFITLRIFSTIKWNNTYSLHRRKNIKQYLEVKKL